MCIALAPKNRLLGREGGRDGKMMRVTLEGQAKSPRKCHEQLGAGSCTQTARAIQYTAMHLHSG